MSDTSDPGPDREKSASVPNQSTDDAGMDRDAHHPKKADGKEDSTDDSNEDKHDAKDAKKDDGNGDGGQSDDPKERRGPGKKPLIILAVIVVLLAIGAFVWWFVTRNEVSTDDAYTDGNVVSIAAQVSGPTVALFINDNLRVRKGDLLFKIDPRDYQAKVDQARAQVGLAEAQRDAARVQLDVARVQYPAQLAQAEAQESSAQAGLINAQASYQRQHAVDERATTRENIDTADAQRRTALANVKQAQAQVRTASLVPQQIRQVLANLNEREQQVRQAQAQLEEAELNLSYTEVRAPADGWITRRNLQVGTYVQAGTPVFSLVTTDLWVTANFKENQLTRIRAGDAVTIDVDAYPSLELRGHIDSIQLGTGSRFSAFPAENATGNFVKIVQRVPVKIVIDHGVDADHPLPVGLSVVPTVTLK